MRFGETAKFFKTFLVGDVHQVRPVVENRIAVEGVVRGAVHGLPQVVEVVHMAAVALDYRFGIELKGTGDVGFLVAGGADAVERHQLLLLCAQVGYGRHADDEALSAERGIVGFGEDLRGGVVRLAA